MGKKTTNNYIDNKVFYQAMIEWRKLVDEANELDEPRPPVTEYIGKCFMDIAEHLAYKPNFINYPYREEMVGDGIENCLLYCHNFDPEKSKNPFSYFTQIIYYAFLRRIEREKKQNYIKYKSIMMQDQEGHLRKYYPDNFFEPDDSSMRKMFNLSDNDVEKFTPKKKKKKKKNEDSTDK